MIRYVIARDEAQAVEQAFLAPLPTKNAAIHSLKASYRGRTKFRVWRITITAKRIDPKEGKSNG